MESMPQWVTAVLAAERNLHNIKQVVFMLWLMRKVFDTPANFHVLVRSDQGKDPLG